MRCSRWRCSAAGCCATGGGSVVGSYGSDQATLRVVARLVAARDRERPPSAPDRPRLRARRLEPRLDELHPGALAAGVAADRGLRAGGRLRRARARGAARSPPGAPTSSAASWARDARRAGGRPRLRLQTYEAAETLNHLNLALVFTLPLAGYLVARYLRGGLSDRRFVVLFALCVLGIFATFLETLFWATIGGAFALAAGLACHARPRARPAVPLPAAVQRRLCRRAASSRRRSCGSRWRTPTRSGSAATASSSTSPT